MSQVATMLLIGAALAVVAGLFLWLMTKLSPTGGLFGTLAGGTLPAAKGPTRKHIWTDDEWGALDRTIESVERRCGSADSRRIKAVIEMMLTHPELKDPGPDGWDHDYWNTWRQEMGIRWY
jgi:hypothetical protein